MTPEEEIGKALSDYLAKRLTSAAFKVKVDGIIARDPGVVERLKYTYEMRDVPSARD